MFESFRFCSPKPAAQGRLLVADLEWGAPPSSSRRLSVLTKESLTTSTTLGASSQAWAAPRLCPFVPGAGAASAKAATIDTHRSSIAGSGWKPGPRALGRLPPSGKRWAGIAEIAVWLPLRSSPAELLLPSGTGWATVQRRTTLPGLGLRPFNQTLSKLRAATASHVNDGWRNAHAPWLHARRL